MRLLDWLRGHPPIEDETRHLRTQVNDLKVALMLKQRRAEALRREVLKVEKLPR